MPIDRNAILTGYMDDYKTYSTNTSGVGVEKVLKFSGRNFDIRERSDVRKEAVVFKFENGTSDYEVDDDKPQELNQNFQALVYVDQADNKSAKEARYNRMLELTDDLINWSLQVVGANINASVWTVTFTTLGQMQEDDGYISCDVNFQSRIDLT